MGGRRRMCRRQWDFPIESPVSLHPRIQILCWNRRRRIERDLHIGFGITDNLPGGSSPIGDGADHEIAGGVDVIEMESTCGIAGYLPLLLATTQFDTNAGARF